jgi:hypothetical protein
MKHRAEYKEKIKKHFNRFRLEENSDVKRRKSSKHQSVGRSPSIPRVYNEYDTFQQETMYMPSPISSEISLVDNDLLASVNSYLLPSNAFVDMGDHFSPHYADINCFLGLNQFVGNQTVPLHQHQHQQVPMNSDIVPVADISQLLHNTNLNDYSPPEPPHVIDWCELPSRPRPPILKNGPNYVMPSPGFIAYFQEIDADDSGTITFDELRDYLHNKDKTNPRHFNDEAVSTLIEMFDKSKSLARCLIYTS